jgi:cell division septation protein DedD
MQMKQIQIQRGSTTLGMIVGVVLGLAVALGVSLYLANATGPVQTKAGNTAARIDPPKDINKAPDPNESLYTKVPKAEEPEPAKAVAAAASSAVTAPVATANPTPAPPATKPEQDGIGKIAAIVTPAPAAPASVLPSKPVDPVAMPKAAPAAVGAERYFVQAGAYTSEADAQAIKAKLALQGVTMGLSPRERDGQTLHRVRTAPLSAVDAERLRNTLKANGIETSLVKVQ